jgi:hypothetical protein
MSARYMLRGGARSGDGDRQKKAPEGRSGALSVIGDRSRGTSRKPVAAEAGIDRGGAAPVEVGVCGVRRIGR